jgi:protein TonB
MVMAMIVRKKYISIYVHSSFGAMTTHIALTSQQVVILCAGLFLLIVAIIVAGRYLLKRTSHTDLAARYAKAQHTGTRGRSKYPAVDIFQYRGIFTGLGLAVALALTIGLLAWTTYSSPVDIPDYDLTIEEDITIEPPRTSEPPAPPPPPPPPVIQEVPDEMVFEEEEVTFMDQSIEAETEVKAPPPVVSGPAEEEAAPPPPPPPPPAPEVEEIFKVVEEMPRFPGCEEMPSAAEKKACADKKLLAFIYANIKYPPIARENNVQGNVVVSFVVNRDGSIEQIKVLRDIGAGCGEEAVRVIELMQDQGIKWHPGRQRGKPVRVQFLMPVRFTLVT